MLLPEFLEFGCNSNCIPGVIADGRVGTGVTAPGGESFGRLRDLVRFGDIYGGYGEGFPSRRPRLTPYVVIDTSGADCVDENDC